MCLGSFSLLLLIRAFPVSGSDKLKNLLEPLPIDMGGRIRAILHENDVIM